MSKDEPLPRTRRVDLTIILYRLGDNDCTDEDLLGALANLIKSRQLLWAGPKEAPTALRIIGVHKGQPAVMVPRTKTKAKV